MEIQNVKLVCVVGAGTMGKQIALNAAINKFNVNLVERLDEKIQGTKNWIKDYLQSKVDKGRIEQKEMDDILNRMQFFSRVRDGAMEADIVIEAITENKKEKEELFRELNKIVKKDTVIATNSSYICSSCFVDLVDNPGRLANLHYFNPALVMDLVEIVQGEHTSTETIQLLMDYAKKVNKSPVLIKKEIEGFIVNRISRAINYEAFYLLENGIASIEDIDYAIEKGLNHPMGPFKLQDFTGIDIAYLTAERIYKETNYKRPGYNLLKEKYESGEIGRKVSKGWYDYSKENSH